MIEYFSNNESLIYPGVYIPLQSEKELKTGLKHSRRGKNDYPPVNMIETEDSIKVEMAVPGLNREDFFIDAYGNKLLICVIQKKPVDLSREKSKTDKVKYNCFSRQVILPENTDTEFISAEYNSGILRLFFPKITHPVSSLHTRIAVY